MEETNNVGINSSLSTRLLSHLHGNQRALYFVGSLNELHRKDDYRLAEQLPALLCGETGGLGDKNQWINQFFHWRLHNRYFGVGKCVQSMGQQQLVCSVS